MVQQCQDEGAGSHIDFFSKKMVPFYKIMHFLNCVAITILNQNAVTQDSNYIHNKIEMF